MGTNRSNFRDIISSKDSLRLFTAVHICGMEKVMPIIITQTEKITEKNGITRIVCPECGEKVKGVGLEKNSKIEGLVFRCKRCGTYHSVTTK